MGQLGLVSELWFFANMLCVGDEGVYSRIEARDTPICTFVGARDWQYISYCFLPFFLFFFWGEVSHWSWCWPFGDCCIDSASRLSRQWLSPPPSSGITGVHSHTQPFALVPGTKTHVFMLMHQALYLLSLAFSPALWMQILLEEAELKSHDPKQFLQSHQKWRWEKFFRLLLDKHRVLFLFVLDDGIGTWDLWKCCMLYYETTSQP